MAATAAPLDDDKKRADEPLSPREAARMKEHFRFLREHRKLLQLRVNAQEDLLLNGVKEPTHRGVCEHLLGKVDRARVELVLERLDPPARTRLLAGILSFSAELPYLLSYLESLGDSTSRREAGAALGEALRRIDFSSVSSAQMRRVLELIVELFSAEDRPQLMFGLLQSSTFREAFDKSTERLPDALFDIVVPLRAVHAVLIQRGKNPHDAAALARGVRMLLGSHEKVLEGYRSGFRQQLLELGLGLRGGRDLLRGLSALVASFEPDQRLHSSLGLRLAAWCGAQRFDADAVKLLRALSKRYPELKQGQHWLDAFEGPRSGRIASGRRGADSRDGARDGFTPAVSLDGLRPVWLWRGTAENRQRLQAASELGQRLVLPGLCGVVESGELEGGAYYLAVSRAGRPANEIILHKHGVAPDVARLIVTQGLRLLFALGALGVQLPDVRFRRFSLADDGQLWLRDWVDAQEVTPETAGAAQLELGRSFVFDVTQRASGALLDESVLEQIQQASSIAELTRLCEAWP